VNLCGKKLDCFAPQRQIRKRFFCHRLSQIKRIKKICASVAKKKTKKFELIRVIRGKKTFVNLCEITFFFHSTPINRINKSTNQQITISTASTHFIRGNSC
jgi:hypothetical protein